MKATNIKAKVISILLTLVMLFGMLPISVFAANKTVTVTVSSDGTSVTMSPSVDYNIVDGSTLVLDEPNDYVFVSNELKLGLSITHSDAKIISGAFNETVDNMATIAGGTFNGLVTNNGRITGGTFNASVANNAVFEEGVMVGGIITGGTFNEGILNYGGTVPSGVRCANVGNLGLATQRLGTGSISIKQNGMYIPENSGKAGEIYNVSNVDPTKLIGLYMLTEDETLPTEDFKIEDVFTPVMYGYGGYDFTMPNEAVTIAAVFDDYSTVIAISAVSSNNSRGSVSGGGGFMKGNQVTLTATAEQENTRFYYWLDNSVELPDEPTEEELKEAVVSYDSTYTFTAEKDTSLTAVFGFAPYLYAERIAYDSADEYFVEDNGIRLDEENISFDIGNTDLTVLLEDFESAAVIGDDTYFLDCLYVLYYNENNEEMEYQVLESFNVPVAPLYDSVEYWQWIYQYQRALTVAYLRHTHTYETLYDDTYHWEECSCEDVQNKAEHQFDNEQDTTCDCGYTRTVEHVHAWGDWVSGGDRTHTRVCSIDSSHTETADCRDETDSDNLCDACGATMISITITTGSMANATLGVAYSQSFAYTVNASAELFWNATGLPDGLAINSSTGVVSGTPTKVGTYEVTVEIGATGGASASKSFTLTVEEPKHEHSYSADHNDTYHWEECYCGDVRIMAEHHFDNEQDTTCDCGYTRTLQLDVTVAGKDVTITYDPDGFDLAGMFTVDPNAGVATYTVEAGGTGVGTVNGSKLTITKSGTFTIKLSTSANGAYRPAEATAILTVEKATPNIEDLIVLLGGRTFSIPNGMSVSSLILPEGFSWEAPTFSLNGNTSGKTNIIYTPSDTDNYNSVKFDVDITASAYTVIRAPVGNDVKKIAYVAANGGWCEAIVAVDSCEREEVPLADAEQIEDGIKEEFGGASLGVAWFDISVNRNDNGEQLRELDEALAFRVSMGHNVKNILGVYTVHNGELQRLERIGEAGYCYSLRDIDDGKFENYDDFISDESDGDESVAWMFLDAFSTYAIIYEVEEQTPDTPSSPQTGDNSHTALWMALLFVSGGAIIILAVTERRRRNAI